tara:strand:- start:2074 stop:2523 length:450 start_codon:yes stop_codon:yes gene_type:complete
MSRVARAARVASRQRVETIDAGSADASKSITAAETGELYFIDATNNVTITLPPVQDGAYFKFMISVLVGTSKSVVINANEENVLMDGYLVQESAGGNIDALSQSNASDNDRITFGQAAKAGSFVECYSDGTKWMCYGRATGGTLAFGDQ